MSKIADWVTGVMHPLYLVPVSEVWDGTCEGDWGIIASPRHMARLAIQLMEECVEDDTTREEIVKKLFLTALIAPSSLVCQLKTYDTDYVLNMVCHSVGDNPVFFSLNKWDYSTRIPHKEVYGVGGVIDYVSPATNCVLSLWHSSVFSSRRRNQSLELPDFWASYHDLIPAEKRGGDYPALESNNVLDAVVEVAAKVVDGSLCNDGCVSFTDNCLILDICPAEIKVHLRDFSAILSRIKEGNDSYAEFLNALAAAFVSFLVRLAAMYDRGAFAFSCFMDDDDETVSPPRWYASTAEMRKKYDAKEHALENEYGRTYHVVRPLRDDDDLFYADDVGTHNVDVIVLRLFLQTVFPHLNFAYEHRNTPGSLLDFALSFAEKREWGQDSDVFPYFYRPSHILKPPRKDRLYMRSDWRDEEASSGDTMEYADDWRTHEWYPWGGGVPDDEEDEEEEDVDDEADEVEEEEDEDPETLREEIRRLRRMVARLSKKIDLDDDDEVEEDDLDDE